MTDSCKRLATGGDKVDRLTDLPINVSHQIQEKMSIEDSMRMSVLSKAWRYVWASNPKLVFDTQFCSKRQLSSTIDIISTILLQHQGSIKIFLLDMSLIHSSRHSVVDQWMLLLSRNGVVDLTIQNVSNVSAPYKLPLHVYGVELEKLELSNCIFEPPCGFRGFQKLKSLTLNRVTFELETENCSFGMPNLEKLFLWQCNDLRFLNIYAPELLHFCFLGCGTDTLKLGPLMECGKLKTIGLASQKEVPSNKQDEAVKSTNLLKCWPNLVDLIMDKYFLKFLVHGIEAERLHRNLNRLRYIYFCNYDFGGEDHTFALLSILRSSPNLEELLFLMCPWKKGIMEEDVNHFKGLNCRALALKRLRILQIKNFHGSKTELFFVRLILAAAPLLKQAILLADKNVCESLSLKISKKLMLFPRASRKLEIIYKPWSGKQARPG